MDMISNLPNETISHIGSLLSAKEAAFAMVLSKRWRNLFTIVPELHFASMVKDGESFKDFSDRVFALPVNTHIRKFFLEWESEYIEPAHIKHCLSHALKRGVLDLELRVYVKTEEEEEDEELKEEDRYSLPLEVLSSKTVEKLILRWGFVIGCLPATANFPALKSLSLHYVLINGFDTLLSACPVLEELVIYDLTRWKWSHTVSSQSIKRLTIRNDSEYWGYCVESQITFDTPALTYLSYSDYTQKGYPILNTNSLVEANIDVCYYKDLLSDPINLFNGLKTVEILTLTGETMELIQAFGEAVPIFENLSHLILWSEKENCWDGLRVLLQKSPKFKTLTIAGSLHCNEEDGRLEPFCECLLGY